jgi:hypothetical protein
MLTNEGSKNKYWQKDVNLERVLSHESSQKICINVNIHMPGFEVDETGKEVNAVRGRNREYQIAECRDVKKAVDVLPLLRGLWDRQVNRESCDNMQTCWSHVYLTYRVPTDDICARLTRHVQHKAHNDRKQHKAKSIDPAAPLWSVTETRDEDEDDTANVKICQSEKNPVCNSRVWTKWSWLAICRGDNVGG